MRLMAHTYSNKGGRGANEDSVGCHIGGSGGVFVLADGLGGHKNGATAADIARQTLLGGLIGGAATPEAVISAFSDANAAILKKQEEQEFRQIRTTAVALRIAGDNAVWGHIGDSRLYCFSGGGLTAVTRDHSVSYKKYLGGEIAYRDICTDDDRASLLSVLGKQETCIPETSVRTVRPGDAFLLCSDGFWEYVYDEEMHIDLLKSKTPREWADFMLLRHIRRTRPDNDNLSVITVFAG